MTDEVKDSKITEVTKVNDDKKPNGYIICVAMIVIGGVICCFAYLIFPKMSIDQASSYLAIFAAGVGSPGVFRRSFDYLKSL